MARFFLLLALFTIFACKWGNDDLINNFAVVYAELRIAEKEFGNTEKGDTVRSEILQKHAMDADIFEEKIDEIKNKPEKWMEFQNRLIAILDSIETDLKNEGEK